MTRLRWASLQHVRATWPQLKATHAYMRLLAGRGGMSRGQPSWVGILIGGDIHLCVVADGKLQGNGEQGRRQ